jgi:Cu-Zn family superoxide dismutase
MKHAYASIVIAASAAVLLSGESTSAQQSGTARQQSQGTMVEMKDAKGSPVGSVQVRQLDHGVVFIADLKNLPPGPHGLHIHERGVCEAPNFQSAGGHYAPQGHEHGFDAPKGFHAGDLPNVHVTDAGTAKAEFFSNRLTLRETATVGATGSRSDQAPFTLLDQSGSAIMIHQSGDDYKGPDSAGARIACGVIKAPAR